MAQLSNHIASPNFKLKSVLQCSPNAISTPFAGVVKLKVKEKRNDRQVSFVFVRVGCTASVYLYDDVLKSTNAEALVSVQFSHELSCHCVDPRASNSILLGLTSGAIVHLGLSAIWENSSNKCSAELYEQSWFNQSGDTVDSKVSQVLFSRTSEDIILSSHGNGRVYFWNTKHTEEAALQQSSSAPSTPSRLHSPSSSSLSPRSQFRLHRPSMVRLKERMRRRRNSNYMVIDENDFRHVERKSTSKRNPTSCIIVSDSPINDIALSAKGKLAIAQQSGLLSVLDIEQRPPKKLGLFRSSYGGLTCVKWGHNESLIASGGEDDCINVWRLDSGTCIARLQGHRAWLTDIHFFVNSFEDDVLSLLSVADDGFLCSWTVPLQTISKGSSDSHSKVLETGQGAPHPRPVSCTLISEHPIAGFAVSKHHMMTVCRNGEVQIWTDQGTSSSRRLKSREANH